MNSHLNVSVYSILHKVIHTVNHYMKSLHTVTPFSPNWRDWIIEILNSRFFRLVTCRRQTARFGFPVAGLREKQHKQAKPRNLIAAAGQSEEARIQIFNDSVTPNWRKGCSSSIMYIYSTIHSTLHKVISHFASPFLADSARNVWKRERL